MSEKDLDFDYLDRFEAFRTNEVVHEEGMQLDPQTRYMAILAVLLGCQGIDEFKLIVSEALDCNALTPVEIKEIVYQAIDYLGIGRVRGFINATNEVLLAHGISLPLESQTTTTMENRLEKGVEKQVELFGEHMSEFYKGSHINRWLAANCFGDVYTRTGLNNKQREMITFCYLYAQGGCEPQLTSHTAANMRLGNDEAYLMKVVSQCVPYIGYPRTLNAITIIHKVAESQK